MTQALTNRLINFILYNWGDLENAFFSYLHYKPNPVEAQDYSFWVGFLFENFNDPKNLKSLIQNLSKNGDLSNAERRKLNGILSHLSIDSESGWEIKSPRNNIDSIQQISLLVIYHEKDTDHVKQLERQLSPSILNRKIEFFARYKITPGHIIDTVQENALKNANFIICMMSADLLSDEKSITQILLAKSHIDKLKMSIIPVIISWCNWQDLLGTIQHLPRDKNCILEYPQIEKSYFDIAFEIETMIKNMNAT